jgi:hypothetical protein
MTLPFPAYRFQSYASFDAALTYSGDGSEICASAPRTSTQEC